MQVRAMKSPSRILDQTLSRFLAKRPTSPTVDAFMGINADRSLQGNFFLLTNGQTPFNQGETGKVYQESRSKPTLRVF
jgi:hypothetical protein